MTTKTVSPKSLATAESQRVRAALRALLEKYGTQQKLARQLRISQQTVSTALNGRSGVSLARKVAMATGQSFDELVTGRPQAGSSLRDDPRWAAALEEARRRNKTVPEKAFGAAGNLVAGSRVPNLDAKFVAGLARVWWDAS